MKKLLIYIFIPVLAILLMSHNVSAVSFNLYATNAVVYYSTPGSSTVENITLTNLYEPPNFSEMRAYKVSTNYNVNLVCFSLNRSIPKDTRFSFTLSALNTSVGNIVGIGKTKITSVSPIKEQSNNYNVIAPISYFITGVTDDITSNICVGGGGSGYSNVVLFYDDGSVSTDMYILQPRFNFYDEINPVNDTLNDTKQETQDAADDSSTESNNNSTDQTTSNLLGVFGSFVTALTSISPSNCNVDFDLGHIDFGVQNLCSQPVPQAFTVVTSIIVVCFTIPFVVHLIKRILGLIREMQT